MDTILGLDEIESFNTPIDDIETEHVNLVMVGVDESGSMSSYVKEMEKCLGEFKEAISNSKETDSILVCRGNFNQDIDIQGYKKIDDFDVMYKAEGMTKLFDIIVEGGKKLEDYVEYLKNNGTRVKVVFSIFSDGEDTASYNSLASAKSMIESLNQKEYTTAFISFGGASAQIAKYLGFANILSVGSSVSDLRHAFNQLSKSVVSSSKSVVNKPNDFFAV
jgi:cobalamin biosynthesis Co2+ chelatase CbiK